MKPSFETCHPQSMHFKQFGEAGCEVHMFGISLGPSAATVYGGRTKPMWLGPDDWDSSEREARAIAVLEGDPVGYITPRFDLEPPNRWLTASVSECRVLDARKRVSSVYQRVERLRQVLWKAFFRLPRIVGSGNHTARSRE